MPDQTGVLRHVNPLQGTDSHHGFSTGNTLPLVSTPFGMTQWSPQTSEGGWFFDARARKLQGIRATHQPSPWIGDYGAIVVLPQVGERKLSPVRRAAGYRPDRSVFKPHLFSTELLGSGLKIEVAPTERCAFFRFQFPKGERARIILEPAKGESFVSVDERAGISGYTSGNTGGVLDGFAMHYAAHFSAPIVSSHTFAGEEIHEGCNYLKATRAGVALEFELPESGELTMRIATSYIDADQARRNLAVEIGDASFEEICLRAEETWENALGKIQIDQSDLGRTQTFYTCLYRTHLFPHLWHEFDASGNPFHRSPYDGGIHPGVLYTDNGFWDTYRTEYPLLALLDPDRLTEILQGWVNAYTEGGWFPQWASPGYRACMVGTHIDAVIADGVVRGVTGFDVRKAFEGMLKHAYRPGDPSGAFGRIGIEDYIELGFVASDEHHEACARSLDYAYDDFCISQVAEALGEKDEANGLLERAQNYRHSFDSSTGFMRGRNADGSWHEPFCEFLWGSPYVEGGPWQSSWAVQHDPAGLIELMGGDTAFAEKLDAMLTKVSRFETGVYGMEIHEMTEMACADFGQYAHSNQPVHHVLYMYLAAGRPWRTQKEVRRVLTDLYSADRLPGDEDNGEMTAWYVLSSLGLFPLCPGRPNWVFGAPLFKWATVALPNGKALSIEAPENSDCNPYVQRLLVNGDEHPGVEIGHAELAGGAKLTFEMGPTAKEDVLCPKLRPTSCSPYRGE